MEKKKSGNTQLNHYTCILSCTYCISKRQRRQTVFRAQMKSLIELQFVNTVLERYSYIRKMTTPSQATDNRLFAVKVKAKVHNYCSSSHRHIWLSIRSWKYVTILYGILTWTNYSSGTCTVQLCIKMFL